MHSASLVPVTRETFAPFASLLEKVKRARPLTNAEKQDTAEAFADPAIDTMAETMADKLARARRLAAEAVRRDDSITSNPFSDDDNPLEREAWFEEYSRILAGLETDA